MPLRKSPDNKPHIAQVTPPAAIAGGELQIRGKGFARSERPLVTIGEIGAPLVISSDSFVIARVPEGASAGDLVIRSAGQTSESWACDIGVLIAENLHPVSNPAVDNFGNIYTTFSGSRGQKVPVAVYKIDLNLAMKPFIAEMMNATGPGIRRSRHALHQQPLRWFRLPGDAVTAACRSTWKAWAWLPASPSTASTIYTSATAAAPFSRSAPTARFSSSPRSSPPWRPIIWRSDRTATCTSPAPPLRASIASTASPTTAKWRSSIAAWAGRKGMAFDEEGNLYVASSIGGRRGVVRIGQDRQADLFLSGPGIVGLAFTPSRAMIVATTNALHRVDVGIKGRPLF